MNSRRACVAAAHHGEGGRGGVELFITGDYA